MRWQFLRLTGLGVIAEAELELSAGFTAVTGETGAGKTMVVTALGLLGGAKADAALVRRGDDRALVEATIEVPVDGAPAVSVVEAGGRLDDDLLVVTRTVSGSGGRSRATAGGVTVPASLLADVTAQLVTVHGQSDQHRLARPAQQRVALDRFAGPELDAVLADYRAAHHRLRELDETLDELRTHAAQRLQELDLLRHGLAEIAEVDPQPGEDETLAAEENTLAHAESLVRAAATAGAALGDDENAVADGLSAAVEVLTSASGHDPRLDALGERLQAALIDITDITSELHAYAADVDLDPARLATVQERRAAIRALQRRYGPGVDDVIAWAADAAGRADTLDADDETIEALEAERAELEPRRRSLAARLHELRTTAAAELSERVGAELAALSMPSARLDIRVSEVDPGPHGADEVEYWFCANSGMESRPMARSASGGELSRLMLALEVVLADTDPVPLMVFDEVDAGIGGRAAVEVGRRLARLARHTQVIAVTHLPQVAAFADEHFVLAKSDDGTLTRTDVVKVGGDRRVDELARMLAGVDDSAAAQEHARELLALAHELPARSSAVSRQ